MHLCQVVLLKTINVSVKGQAQLGECEHRNIRRQRQPLQDLEGKYLTNKVERLTHELPWIASMSLSTKVVHFVFECPEVASTKVLFTTTVKYAQLP